MAFLTRHARHKLETLRPTATPAAHDGAVADPMARTVWEVSNGEDVVLVQSWRESMREPLRYRVEVADVILPEEYAGRPDAVKAITQRFTAGLERLVRAHPEQYFWLHRRWKHQPLPRKVQRSKDEARQKEVA